VRRSLWILLSVPCFFLSCLNPTPPAANELPAQTEVWATTAFTRMSLEEKVSQMFVVWTPGNYMARDSRDWQELERLTAKRKIGGFVFSLGDVYEYAVQVNRLQGLAQIPLLIAGDFEYGVAMRVRNTSTFPNAMAIGATRNPDHAYAVGRATAREGRALGVHQNYAPTIDVNNNPRNPVINTRAYGDDPALVTDMGAAFARGTADGGMIATVKHFPGHGDTDVDSHLGLSVLNFDRLRLDTFELAPYKRILAQGVGSVMIGHLAVPAIDSVSSIPATVSPKITTELLRNELKFNGLVVSDALQMRGITANYEPGEAAVLAVKAGIDLVLMPVDPDIAIDAVIAAVRRGEIAESQIDESVMRILKEKERLGLHRKRLIDVDRVADVVGCREHQELARQIARDAVTVLGNGKNVLPLDPQTNMRVLDLVLCERDDPEPGRDFHELLRDRFGKIDYARIDGGSSACDCDTVVARAQRADLIIIQMHFYTRSGEMTGFVRREHCDAIDKIARLKKPMVAISFGNPYVAMNFPRFETYVCAYSNSEVMRQATAEVLFAESPARGKLPITIPGQYRFGEGITYPATRLRVGTLEDGGFDAASFASVEAIMNAAVKDSAFPGAQLLVARNGVIAHNAAYGAFDYSPYGKRVETRTMFDLASVTKVIATTSAVMRLVDEGKLSLSDPVVKHLPAFGQNGKSHITIYNLMLHNSGLPGWRKFYEFCTTPQCVVDSIMASRLAYRTGDSTIYSDLGLITVGKVIEKVSGTTLDRFVDSVFYKPLGMTNTMYNPPKSRWSRIAPTEVDVSWQRTGVAVQGRVHDENCAVLGGVSGHAGLFSTASDLAIILQMELNGGTYGGRSYLNDATIRQFITRQSERSSRGIGWDTRAPGRSFTGRLTSSSTFMHTGFTGTSVVVDPEKRLIIVLLTNRVHPTRENMKIADVRPRVHDAVIAAIRN